MTDFDPSELHRGAHIPDLLVAALDRNPDKPAVYLGDEVLTARQVRDQISCYAQAFADRGLGRGSAVAMLSASGLMVVGSRALARNGAVATVVSSSGRR